MKLNAIDWLAYILAIVGGLNWGLVGFFNYNLVDEIFGVESTVSRVIYAAVGVSAVYLIYTASKLMHHSDERVSRSRHTPIPH